MKISLLLPIILLFQINCSAKNKLPAGPTNDDTGILWSPSELPKASFGTWYGGGAEQVAIGDDSLELWESFRYLKYGVTSVERSEDNRYRLILQRGLQDFKLAELHIVHPDTLLFLSSASSSLSLDQARELTLKSSVLLTAEIGWSETSILPNGLEGNWLAADSTNELIVRSDSILWEGDCWRLETIQWLPGSVRRLIGIRDVDTLAVYPVKILNSELQAIVKQGSESPLDRRGNLLPEGIETFLRWVHPFVTEIPATGSHWRYSYYWMKTYTTPYSKSEEMHKGTLELEIIDAGLGTESNSFNLKRIIRLDSLRIYSLDSNEGMGPLVIVDSLATNVELESKIFVVTLSSNTYYLEQDSIQIPLISKHVPSVIAIESGLLDLLAIPITVGPEYTTIENKVTVDDNSGIISVNYAESSPPFNTSYDAELHCQLLEYSAGL